MKTNTHANFYSSGIGPVEEREKSFRNHLYDALPTSDDIYINARLTNGGRWFLTVGINKPDGYTKGLKFCRYFKSENIKPIEKWFNKCAEAINLQARGIQLVALHRRSGLFPKHVSKNFSKRSQALFPGQSIYVNRELQNYLISRSARYLRTFAKCPHCGGIGFLENILGWECSHCRAVWEDLFLCQMQWYGVKQCPE